MTLHNYDYDAFSDDDDFEGSIFELYANRQHFVTFFPDNLFGKEGKFFFPGTFNEAESLVNAFASMKDTEELFSMYIYPLLFRDEVKNWPYGKLTCSTLYYYLNCILLTNNLTMYHWKTIAELLQSPVISSDIFSFVNQHNIITFSSKNNRVMGFIDSLLYPSFDISYRETASPLPSVKSLYRLLKLADVERSIIRVSIKTAFSEQDLNAVLQVLDNQLLIETHP